MIAVVDYGAGNIFSVKNALDHLGLSNCVTAGREELARADGIILPGVGAFPAAMNMLQARGLVEVLRSEAARKPLLGICLGMQLLFDTGYEFAQTQGLGLIPGTVEKMEEPPLRIPHIGWNRLEITRDCPLTQGLDEDAYVYFVHSYKAVCEDAYICAGCEYGHWVPALVHRGSVYGAQFHPEKSGAVGMQLLKNFGGLL